MNRARTLRGPSGTTAVSVRLVAFFVALACVVTIPATMLAASAGTLTFPIALATVGVAMLAILVSLFAVRQFDPFRG